MATKTHERLSGPLHDEVARFAYQLYEEDGRPEGKDLEHWYWAEAMLTARNADEGSDGSRKSRKRG